MDHTSEYNGWTIEITVNALNATCWITNRAGDACPLSYPAAYGVNGALSCARAYINRIDRARPLPMNGTDYHTFGEC